MSYQDGFGLREKQHDGTEFSVGAFVKLPLKSELLRKYNIAIPEVLTQTVDTCAKEASQNLMSWLNGTPLNTLLTWVVGRANSGYSTEDWGIDIKSMLMACVKVGALPVADSPYDGDDDRAVFADITRWDLKKLLPKAIVYKAGSAVFVEPANGMDYFDTVKAVMQTLKAPVVMGVRWNFDPLNPNIDTHSDSGFGHALLITGWDEDVWVGREVVLNSWGLSVGKAGYFYFSREVINHDLAIFGAGTLIDETPEKVKWLLDNGIFLDDGNWLLNTAKAFIVAMKRLLTIALDERKIEKGTGVPPYPPKIVTFCETIKRHEGFSIGTRSYRNNSPSNAKYIGQYKSIGADAQGFARFATYEDGWNYLLKIVHNACSGKSLMYPQTMTIYEYFAKYAPASDNNNSKRYAEVVAEACGVSPYLQIKDLL